MQNSLISTEKGCHVTKPGWHERCGQNNSSINIPPHVPHAPHILIQPSLANRFPVPIIMKNTGLPGHIAITIYVQHLANCYVSDDHRYAVIEYKHLPDSGCVLVFPWVQLRSFTKTQAIGCNLLRLHNSKWWHPKYCFLGTCTFVTTVTERMRLQWNTTSHLF
jgi:hypothetical protein